MNPGSGDDVVLLISKSWLLEEALSHLIEAAKRPTYSRLSVAFVPMLTLPIP